LYRSPWVGDISYCSIRYLIGLVLICMFGFENFFLLNSQISHSTRSESKNSDRTLWSQVFNRSGGRRTKTWPFSVVYAHWCWDRASGWCEFYSALQSFHTIISMSLNTKYVHTSVTGTVGVWQVILDLGHHEKLFRLELATRL